MRIARRLGRVGGRLWPGASGFWAWWTQALASWLPLRMRKLFGLASERLLLHAAPDGGLRLTLEHEGDARALGQVPAPDDAFAGDPLERLLSPRVAELPRWLVLPAAAGLRRRLSLPVAAESRLREVLGFEVDRQTPFTSGEVQYDARVVGRGGNGQIEAELVVVPTPVLEAALAALGPLRETLTGADLSAADGRTLGVNLLPGAERRRRIDPWRRWRLAASALALLATIAGMWQMLANRAASASAFESEVATRAELARGAAAEKRRLLDLVEGMAFLQATRAGRPTTVEILDELSRKLPDSTSLEKLSIEGERILLIGYSSEASSLVKRLEDSTLWRSPALTGALQPDPRSGRDRFTLTAELAVSPAAGTAPTPEGSDARGTP